MNKLSKLMTVAVVVSVFAFPIVLASNAAPPAMTVAAPPFHEPHFDAALKLLQDARQELAKAKVDKAGHRAAAMRATDAAIKQTQQGIKLAVD